MNRVINRKYNIAHLKGLGVSPERAEFLIVAASSHS